MATWAGNQRVTLDFLARGQDSTVQPVRGDIIVADSTLVYNFLALGSDETYLGSDGTDALYKRIQGSHVDMAVLGSPTYTTVQHLQNLFHSVGWVSGGAVTDAGSGNINVAGGTGMIRATDSAVAEILFFDWPASNGIAIPSDTVRYVGIEYNSGTPQVVIKSSDSFDNNTDFILTVVINEGGTLHIQNERHAVGDHATQMVLRMFDTAPKRRDEQTGGLILGESGARKVTVSAGALWEKLERFPISAIDTNVSGNFDRYYRASPSGFTKEAAQTDWPNEKYDNGSGTLITMTNNRYAVLWFYIELDGELVMLYGQGQYTSSASAEDEAPPSSVPDRVVHHGRIIGRIIFQKSAGSATEIQSAFTAVFSPTLTTNHDNLAGVSVDDHHSEAHAAAQHNAAVLPGSANEDLGAYYLDVDQIAVPANPAAGTRRVFVDSGTGELSVRTSAGATVSLEGGGGYTDADAIAAVEGEATLVLTGSAVIQNGLGVGSSGAVSADRILDIDDTLTTATSYGVVLTPIADTGLVTLYGLFARITVASGHTLTNARTLFAANPTGAGAVTNVYGLFVENITKGATANYGIYIVGGGTYALFSDSGLNRFDGDGTDVFELPADATDPTGGGGAAAGRIPVKIGGVTKYLAYY